MAVKVLGVLGTTVLLLMACSQPSSWQAAEAGDPVSPQGGVALDTLTFVWHAGDADLYWIQVDNSSTFATPVFEDSTVTDTVWRAPDLLPAGTYYWRVRGRHPGEPWGPWKGPVVFTTPPDLAPLSFVESSGYVHGLALQPDMGLVFYAQGKAGLGLVELDGFVLLPGPEWDDPASQDNARGVFLWPGDTLVYLADTDGGIKILRWQTSGFQYLNAEFGRNVYDLTGWQFQDTLYLYVADQDDGVLVFKVEVPGFLTLLATLPMDGYTYGVATDGNYLYVAQGEAGLAVLSLADPAQPQVVATLDLPGNARQVAVQDTLVAVALKEAGVALVSVADPGQPRLLATYDPFDGYAWDVALSPVVPELYVAAGGGGFWVINIQDAGHPVATGRYTGPYALSVVATPYQGAGTVSFIGGARSGLYAF